MGSGRARTWPVAALLLAALVVLPDDTGGGPAVDPPPHGDGCDQTEYAVHSAHREHPFTWVVNESSIPAYLDREGTLRAINDATATVALTRSSCPMPPGDPPVLPRVIYAGPTERQANVTTAGTCFPDANTDGINVVSFGPLPDDVVAVTCTYSHDGDIWQSDVMLNDTPHLFTLTPGHGCVDSYDLQAVMTHERGHSFGLAHVPETPHTDALTMSGAMGRCDPSARTLATGDVLGLSHLY